MSTDEGLGEFFQRQMNNIRSERDAFVCCLHYSLVSKGYSCIGNGDKLPGSGPANSDELPSDWAKGELCSLMYQQPNLGHLFLVKALSHNCVVLARFVDDKTFTLRVNPSLVIANDFTSFAHAFTNLDQLWMSLESNQLKGFGIPAEEESTCSEPLTSTHRQQDSARKNLEHFLKAFEGGHYGLSTDDHKAFSPETLGPMAPPFPAFSGYGSGSGVEPIGVGQSDLCPLGGGYLGGGGGGMIFDPLRQGGQAPIGGTGEVGAPDFLPRGSVPSGARFDPFSPPELDPTGMMVNQTTAGSDDDEPSPPGFDDMIM